jgi:hypothetical protein
VDEEKSQKTMGKLSLDYTLLLTVKTEKSLFNLVGTRIIHGGVTAYFPLKRIKPS